LANDGSDIHPHAQTATRPSGRGRGAQVLFAWAYTKGDEMAEDLDYVPMPKKIVSEIEEVWAKEIKDSNGKPLNITSAIAQ
jgi:hypothetical protein